MQYRVVWDIDVDAAASPMQAAAWAWKAMRRKGSIATVFTVIAAADPSRRYTVDLTQRTVRDDAHAVRWLIRDGRNASMVLPNIYVDRDEAIRDAALSGHGPVIPVGFLEKEEDRHGELARIPVTLPNGSTVKLSPGGQNPLIKSIVEEFCPRFAPGGRVVYIGDTENKFEHLESAYLAKLGVVIDSAAKMPDVVVHAADRHWLLLIEAVTSAGPIDGKRRMELKTLFSGSTAGLVFVTAFETRRAMQSFISSISWETEVWIADAPDHLIHFDGERFLGPYEDVRR